MIFYYTNHLDNLKEDINADFNNDFNSDFKADLELLIFNKLKDADDNVKKETFKYFELYSLIEDYSSNDIEFLELQYLFFALFYCDVIILDKKWEEFIKLIPNLDNKIIINNIEELLNVILEQY